MNDEEKHYETLAGLENLYLEDSYVLGIVAQPAILRRTMDLVLTKEHPRYESPGPGDQYCMRRGTIGFHAARRLTWTDQGAPPATDASGEIDYGNIDSFTHIEDVYRREGDFGRIEVEADAPAVMIVDA